jgi:hypothetical protein
MELAPVSTEEIALAKIWELAPHPLLPFHQPPPQQLSLSLPAINSAHANHLVSMLELAFLIALQLVHVLAKRLELAPARI